MGSATGVKNDSLKTLGGIALAGVGLVILAGFLFVSHLEKARRSLILPDSLCPAEHSVKVWGFYEIFPPKVPRKIAVVIDATDQIPGEQRDEIADWFKSDFVHSLGRFAKVRIYQLDEVIRDKAPEFEKCAPPSEANPWIENPRIVRETFEENFLNVLLAVVESLASGDEKRFSPILEMARKMFDSYDEIILVSDLMHHTAGHSLYKSVGEHNNYDKFSRTSYATTIAKNLGDKKLTVIYVIREKLKWRQNVALREFWRQHLENNGGEFVVAKTLSAIED